MIYSEINEESFPAPSHHIIELKRMQLGIQQALSPEVLDSAQVNILYDHMLHQFVVQARAYVYSKDLDRVVIEYPADWWQAFKERWFPAALLLPHRWPVRYNRHDINVKVIYPELHKKYSVPDTQSHLRIFREDHYG